MCHARPTGRGPSSLQALTSAFLRPGKLQDVSGGLQLEQEGQTSVPRHLMDGSRDAEALGHGKDYVYPHEFEGHYVPQQYLPRRLLGNYFYRPSGEGYEAQVAARLQMWREAQRRALGIEETVELPELDESKIQEMKRRIR